ncbi:hypothetical protein WN944_014860 [Citrus x changshan-huyou]|uniref:Uncharacterized protein n=1 Tax=Citrus x changshan-huyou TaxID=2935761 RepID=A0AAP0QJ37_9ROSI
MGLLKIIKEAIRVITIKKGGGRMRRDVLLAQIRLSNGSLRFRQSNPTQAEATELGDHKVIGKGGRDWKSSTMVVGKVITAKLEAKGGSSDRWESSPTVGKTAAGLSTNGKVTGEGVTSAVAKHHHQVPMRPLVAGQALIKVGKVEIVFLISKLSKAVKVDAIDYS